MRNLVDELHKRCSKWLCECYGCVLIPKFESSQMVRGGKRKIRSKTAGAMLTWSHYRFRQRLACQVTRISMVQCGGDGGGVHLENLWELRLAALETGWQ